MVSSQKKYLIISIILFISICVDQITKLIAEQQLAGHQPISFMGDFFRLHFAENQGAFLSFGSDWSDPLRFIILTVFPVVFLLILLIYLFITKHLDYVSTYSFALILGGGISNLWNRIFNDGLVTDFMNMGIGSLRTGIFNFADVFITTGICILLFVYIKEALLHKKELR